MGGFVGYNNKTITNCSAGAEVIGRGCYTGGFVGYQNTNGRISYALALAPVNSGISGQTHTGGFSGNDAGSYTSCIFSTTGTQIAASNGAGGTTVSGIVGKSETELLNTSTLSGFDTSIWTIANGSIPTLTLNSNWKVYNDGYDNFNVLKNVVNSDRQYVKVSNSTVEINFESNWDLPLLETVVWEKGSKIVMLPDLSAEGYVFIGWFTDAEFTKPFTVDGTYTVNGDITLYTYFRKIIATPESQTYTYNEEKITLGTLDLAEKYYTVNGIYEAIDAGEYTVTLTPTKNYYWNDNNANAVTINWLIQRQQVAIPQSQIYTYSGELFSLTTLDLTEKYYTVNGIYEAIDAGEYTVTLTLNKNYCWSDNSIDALAVTWQIEKRILVVEKYINYTGESINITNWCNLGKYCTVIGDDTAIDLGQYTVTFAINDPNNCIWEDGTVSNKTIEWHILEFWDGGIDTSWYNTDAVSFVLSNAQQLAGLAQLVNAGNNFNGVTLQLDNYIHLGDKEWIPIATKDFPFSGIFDGSGYMVSNFKVTGNVQCAGLFGHNAGIIQNLGVENFIIDVSSSYSYAGGLVGYNNYGTITNCYATGNVRSRYTQISVLSVSAVRSSFLSGGLVGWNNRGTLATCYAAGAVSSSGFAGGLLGKSDYGTITNCYATGIICSSLVGDAGGLVGSNSGTIKNCYATGDVSSPTIGSSTSSYAAGLVSSNSGTISNCYATGDVSSSISRTDGYNYVGGLVGYSNSGTTTNCYRYSGQSFIVTKNGTTTYEATNTYGTEKDMSELQSVTFQSSTLGWSSDDWTFVEGEHPTLKNVGTPN